MKTYLAKAGEIQREYLLFRQGQTDLHSAR